MDGLRAKKPNGTVNQSEIRNDRTAATIPRAEGTHGEDSVT